MKGGETNFALSRRMRRKYCRENQGGNGAAVRHSNADEATRCGIEGGSERVNLTIVSLSVGEEIRWFIHLWRIDAPGAATGFILYV
jgi:hypothetical protein